MPKPLDYKFSDHQESLRMQIRMHIIEESRAEWREMPQGRRLCPIKPWRDTCGTNVR